MTTLKTGLGIRLSPCRRTLRMHVQRAVESTRFTLKITRWACGCTRLERNCTNARSRRPVVSIVFCTAPEPTAPAIPVASDAEVKP